MEPARPPDPSSLCLVPCFARLPEGGRTGPDTLRAAMPVSGAACPTPRVPRITAQPCSPRAPGVHLVQVTPSPSASGGGTILARCAAAEAALLAHSVAQPGPEPGPSLRPVLPLAQGVSALTAGFRPSLSSVFLLKGPSMVGTAAELPSVQMQGPVGLRGDRGSDAAWSSWGQAGRGGPRGHRECAGGGPGNPHLLTCVSAAERCAGWPSSL